MGTARAWTMTVQNIHCGMQSNECHTIDGGEPTLLQPNLWSRRSKRSARNAGIAARTPDPVATPVSRVARGSFTAFGVYVAGAGLTYCSQLLIARMVGAETYGV